MTDTPEIIKELREAEKLGKLRSEVLSDYEKFEVREESYVDVPVETLGFVEDDTVDKKKMADDSNTYELAGKKLPEKEDIYRFIFENNTAGIGISDTAGNIVKFNRAMCKITGYSDKELLNVNIADTYVNLDDRTQIYNILKKEKEVENFEIQLLNKNKRAYWASLSIKPIVYNGKDAFLTTVIDITKRRETEDEIVRKTQDLNLLNRVNICINQGKSLFEICDTVVKETGRIFSSKDATIYLLSDDGKYLVTMNSSLSRKIENSIEKLVGSKISKIKIPLTEDSFYSNILKNGEPKITNDRDNIQKMISDCTENRVMKKLAPKILGILDISSVISYPLVVEGNCIGLIDISRNIPFNESDLNRFEKIGEQLSTTILKKQMDDSLRISEKKTKAILNASSDAMILIDPKGIALDMNKAHAEKLDKSVNEIIGKCIYNFFPSDTAKFRKTQADKVFNTGKPNRFEESHEGRSYDVQGYPIFDAEGKVIMVAVYACDITERRGVENELMGEKDRTQKYLDIAGVMLVAINNEGNVTLINKKGCEILGYNKEEIVGKNWLDNFVPERTKKGILSVSKQLLDGEIEPAEYFENYVLTKNGEERLITWHNTILKDNDGNIIGHLSSGEDTTERKQAEEELRESEEKFKTIFENVNDEIVYVDKHGKILDVNKRIEDIFGYKTEEIIGKNFTKLGWFGVKDLPKMFKLFKDAIRGKAIYLMELEVKHKDGHIVPIEVSTRPVKKNGKVVGFLSIVRDITERKKAENKLKESEEKYRVLYQTSADGLLIADIETKKFNFANPAICKMLGYSEDELKRMDMNNIHPKDELDYVVSEFEAQARGEKTLAKAIPCLRKDGTIIHADINTTVTSIDGKKCNIGFFRDVTERKKTEEEIKYLKEYNENILESNPNPMMVIKGNQIEYVNNSFVSTFGKTKNDYILKDMNEVMPVEIIPAFEKLLQDHNEKKELEIKGKNFSVSSFVVRKAEEEEEGKRRGIILQDITERKKAEVEIKLAHRELDQIFNTAADGMRVIDKDFNVLRINETLSTLIGINKDEAIGKKCYEMLFSPLCRTPDCPLTRILKGDKHVECEIEKERKDCTKIPCILTATPFKGIDGELLGIVEDFKDITDRKKAEETLKENKEKIKNILESSPDSITVTDLEGNVTECNEATLKLHKFSSKEEVIGKNAFMFLRKGEQKRAMENLQKTLKEGSVKNLEYILLKKDGEEFPAEMSVSVINDASGKPVAFVSITKDITDRKKAEETLRETLETTKTMLEHMPFGVIVVGKDKKIRSVNEAALKITGAEKEKVVGQLCYQNICPTQVDQCPILDLGKTVDKSEKIVLGPNNEKIPILKTVIPITLEGEEMLLETFIDITEQKKAEKKIQQQNIKLKKLDRIKSEFLNVTSHELRTPMSAIKGYTQMVLKQTLGEITEEQKNALDIVLRNTTRLDHLIQDILDISRLESRTMKFIPNQTDLRKMVGEVAETMTVSANLKDIKINMDIEDNLPDLIIDQERIKQVIINIVNNAIKFSPDGSIINVRAKKEKADVLFEIQDYGKGIPKNKQKKVFETFYQIDSGIDRKFGGAGLGLAISRGIILSHNGKIDVKGAIGKGSTFRFTLPLKSVENLENRFKEVDIFGLDKHNHK